MAVDGALPLKARPDFRTIRDETDVSLSTYLGTASYETTGSSV